MQIVADTASLYSPEEAKNLGFKVVSACVVINEKTYKDYQEITTEEFLKMIEEGGIPTSSQPAIGDVMEVFEDSESRDEDILYLPVGDGLSGTYQSAVGIANGLDNKDKIHVLNTKSLAEPQRYLVKKAMKLRDEGLDIEKIKEELHKSIESSISFVSPADFDFLRRSGRLTPIAAKIAGMIKIVPVLTQTEDKRRITLFSIKRTKKKAVAAIIEHFKSLGVDENFLITISHVGVIEEAKAIMEQFRESFSNTAMEMFSLVPSLISHGGPGCVVIQTIRK